MLLPEVVLVTDGDCRQGVVVGVDDLYIYIGLVLEVCIYTLSHLEQKHAQSPQHTQDPHHSATSSGSHGQYRS